MLVNRDLKGIYESPYWYIPIAWFLFSLFFHAAQCSDCFAAFATEHDMQPADAVAQAYYAKRR
jgi:hypothetical protein